MVSSSNIIVFIVTFIFFLTFLPPKSVGFVVSSIKSDRKMVLGSRPPACVNKCLNCKPCVATTLIIHSHKEEEIISREEHYSSSSHGGRGDDDDDTYYLVSWKCKCGNKLFQP